MKAILIDTLEAEIKEIELEEEYMEDMYKILGCDLVQSVPVQPDPDHVLLVDEEAVFRSVPTGGFLITGFRQPIIGHGIIVGTGGSEWTDCTLTADNIIDNFVSAIMVNPKAKRADRRDKSED